MITTTSTYEAYLLDLLNAPEISEAGKQQLRAAHKNLLAGGSLTPSVSGPTKARLASIVEAFGPAPTTTTDVQDHAAATIFDEIWTFEEIRASASDAPTSVLEPISRRTSWGGHRELSPHALADTDEFDEAFGPVRRKPWKTRPVGLLRELPQTHLLIGEHA